MGAGSFVGSGYGIGVPNGVLVGATDGPSADPRSDPPGLVTVMASIPDKRKRPVISENAIVFNIVPPSLIFIKLICDHNDEFTT